jgi:transposase
VRVPPKMMAGTRKRARTSGKSDPIDALAVARAALQEPDLPAAGLDGPAREVRLLVDHRDNLVSERTRLTCRLRWHLHELDPAWDPPLKTLNRYKRIDEVIARLGEFDGLVARLALEHAHAVRDLIRRVNDLEREIKELVTTLAPTLLAMPGCGVLSAAKIVGETADVTRFKSKDAFARHNGTAPLPVWSGNRERFRLSRARQPPAELRDPPHRRDSEVDVTHPRRSSSSVG